MPNANPAHKFINFSLIFFKKNEQNTKLISYYARCNPTSHLFHMSSIDIFYLTKKIVTSLLPPSSSPPLYLQSPMFCRQSLSSFFSLFLFRNMIWDFGNWNWKKRKSKRRGKWKLNWKAWFLQQVAKSEEEDEEDERENEKKWG